jgi:DNA-binding GntR family transcriptional regulator
MIKMRQNIYVLIRDRIIHQDFKPGDPLNENKLASEFQVSRTPVREALHRLSSEGLIAITPNLGARVADVNLRDFRELIEFRIILERGAARLVSRNATEKDMEAMAQLGHKLESEQTRDLDRLTDLDTEFHLIIRQATHNRLLQKQMEVIQIKFTWVMRLIGYRPELIMVRIPDFIEAMQQHDADRLEHMLVEHVEYFVERLRQETIKNF